MRLKYETGVATLIQFIIASFFILVSQIGSTATSCLKDHRNCVINTITAIIFFIVVSLVFGAVWFIGYAAQDRRSKRLSRLLICAEGFITLLALFSLKLNLHTHSIPGLVASLGALAMSIWILTLAFRLLRAGGGRVVNHSRSRPRQRIRKPPVSPAV